MEIVNQYNEVAAVLIARVFLGVLFFFQGYDAVFKVKIKNVIATFESSFAKSSIPKVFIVAASWFTTLTELVCGLLLIVGLFESVALFLLGINLVVAAIGFGISTPMWDTRHVFPRLALLLFLLFVPQSYNILSLDNLIFKP